MIVKRITLKDTGIEVDGGNCYFSLHGQTGTILKEFKNGKMKVKLDIALYSKFKIVNIEKDWIS